MNELSYANIEFLKNEVSKSGITYSHLRDDLIDHLCCDVEAEMQNGLAFEKAYDMVVQKIGFKGLQQIQEDTLYLIDKNYRFMKNMMKFTGVVSPVLIAFGALFKMEHWPLAGILLVLGFFSLCFFFLPSALYVSYKEISNKTRKFTYTSAFLGTFFLSASFLFKVMHWPMASIFLLTGVVIICFIFLPSLVFSKTKENDPNVPNYVYILAYAGFILYLLGFEFKMMHWPGATIMILTGAIIFVFIAIPIYTYKKYRKHTVVAGSFIFIIIALIWFVVPVTLMSLNVSKNLLKTNAETEVIYLESINYFKAENDLLIEKLPNDLQNTISNAGTKHLVKLIEDIKEQIAGGEKSYRAILSGNTESLNVAGSCARILSGEKGKELIRAYADWRNEIIVITGSTKIKSHLTNTLTPSLDKELFNMNATNASSINNLSFLQLNILMTENFYLSALNVPVNKQEIAMH